MDVLGYQALYLESYLQTESQIKYNFWMYVQPHYLYWINCPFYYYREGQCCKKHI